MIRLFIFICLVWPACCFSQGFIHKSRQQVKRELEKQIAKNDTLHILLLETDTSLHYSVRDPQLQPADFIYTFDESGKCNMEKVIASCDSCFTKYLQSALHNKRYQWKKLNNHLYISGFVQKRLLEIPVNSAEHSYTIRRMKWNRSVYNTLLTTP
jgi:hypothetical protein